MRRLLSMATLVAVCASLAARADEPAAKRPKSVDTPAVEVVFVLDTTGSMSGLINAAKEKVWAIANTLATAKPAPDIRMGLVAYRDRGDAYITQVTNLTDDLDAVYKELMDFQAQGGGDGPESVNQALHEALTKIKWSTDEKTYRVVFLVGDAPPHMDYKDDIQYPASCKSAAEKDIVINTIQCGENTETKPVWMKIAQLAEGQYFQVEQSGGAILEATPFDKDLAKLSSELGETRVYFGRATVRNRLESKAEAADEAAAAGAPGAAARRAEFLAKDAAKRAFAGESELVEGVTAGTVKLNELRDEELPENLRKLAPAEREKFVKDLAEKRAEIQKKIAELSQKRQDYIREQLKTKAGSEEDSLDHAVFGAIQKQAAEKGLDYKEVQY